MPFVRTYIHSTKHPCPKGMVQKKGVRVCVGVCVKEKERLPREHVTAHVRWNVLQESSKTGFW